MKIEFSKVRQTVLVGYRAWPDKCTNEQTVYIQLALFIPLSMLVSLQIRDPSFSLRLVLPLNIWKSLTQSQNVFPFHPIMCLTPLSSITPQSERC